MKEYRVVYHSRGKESEERAGQLTLQNLIIKADGYKTESGFIIFYKGTKEDHDQLDVFY